MYGDKKIAKNKQNQARAFCPVFFIINKGNNYAKFV